MNTLREKNLRSLRRSNPGLADRLGQTPPADLLEILPSRSGEPVPAVAGRGRRLALHSLFDPVKEANRLADAVLSGEGGVATGARECYLYFEGLGGGYHIRQALARSDATCALILETDAALVSELIAKIDLSDILSDRRVRLLVDTTPEETADLVRSTYLPGVMGPFLSVPLRQRVDLAAPAFTAHRRHVRAALDAAADDYTVQAGFGRLWTRNILTNLPLIASSPPKPPIVEEAIVTSAGPSLEERLDELARLRQGRFLIATDTSLPALILAGYRPDAVLTIDCQYLSYYHFLSGLPSPALLVAELAAPPGILRRAATILPVSSGHPLSRLAAAELGGILPVDTSGGNVGHAAVSLAIRLGARSVHLFGADFSYPFGKPYARGTFLYDYFDERAARVTPAEGGVVSLLYRNTTVERDELDGGFRYTTKTMRSYRDRFLKAFAPVGARVHPVVANGLPMDLPAAGTAAPHDHMLRDGPAAGLRPPSQEEVRRFLRRYRDAVVNLPDRVPEPSSSPLDPGIDDEWTVFASLYPLIARLRRGARSDIRAEELLVQAKTAVIVMLQRLISQWDT